MPLFFGDFLGATAEWDGEERALYLLLLGYQWTKGSIPAEPKRVCNLARWDWDLFAEKWRKVGRKFDLVSLEIDGEVTDRLVNLRLELHREKTRELSKKNSNSGVKGATGKWGDREGTPDHAATRAQRLIESRKRGTHQPAEWAALLVICGPACLKCGALGSLVKDHIVPIYQAGSDAIDNLQPLCKKCNCSKGPDRTDFRPNDWRERLAKVIETSGVARHQEPKMSGDMGDSRLAKSPLMSGNPSHPIPSHPTPDISSQDLSGAALVLPARRAADFPQSEQAGGATTAPANGERPRAPATPPETPETFQVEPDPLQHKPGSNPLPAGAMAAALRNARVQTTSDDPTLLAWIRDGITTEQLLEAVDVAKLRKPREAIPANYLDPIVRELRAKAGAAPTKPKQETPAEREWRVLRAEAAQDGFHRQPGASETPDQYRAALKQHQRDAASRAAQRLADLGGALKAVPK